jgi:hypothetical protein
MSFRDCEQTSFASLKRLTTTVKPYRGTDNIFPLGNRKYKGRNFRWYGSHADVYYYSSILCRVHEDESVEFVTAHYGNGDNMLLTSMFWPSFSVNIRGEKGGVIASVPQDKKEYLIFDGLRLDLKTRTVHATTPYEIEVARLDRAKTKVIRDRVEPEINMIKAFFMASDDKQIIEASKDRETRDDPFVNFCRIGYQREILRESWSKAGMLRTDANRKTLFDIIKREYLEEIYRDEEPFKYHRIPAGATIPPGSWGINVVKLFNKEAL